MKQTNSNRPGNFQNSLAGAVLLALALQPSGLRAVEMSPHEMTVDFEKPCGMLRALHGVNNGPLPVNGQKGPDLTEHFKEAAIPNCRLHDASWSGARVVDIPFIFPLPHLDPNDQKNYVFARTDDYIQGIISVGAQVVYRLGVSVEHAEKKYDTHPPADFERWAQVCVNILRHYNEGWADGFRHNIQYWEVWNEPKNKNSWSGTAEDYQRLYATTARAIKQHDSAMKVGGPVQGPGGAYLENFLVYCRDNKVPLDFCSWHSYVSKPHLIKKGALEMQSNLEKYGFPKTESVITEWHWYRGSWSKLRLDPEYRKATFDELNGPAGAAFSAAVLLMLQDTTVSIANYYTGDTLAWGLFEERSGTPKKAYYAFKAFGKLLETPQRVACTGGNEEEGLVIGAGLSNDKKTAQILLTNFESKSSRFRIRLDNLPWSGPSEVEVFSVDGTRNLDSVMKKRLNGSEAVIEVDCPAPSLLLLRLSPSTA